MSRYLVTGGAGFIGSHLTVALVRAGHQVRILDDFSTGNLANLHGVASEVLGGDVRDSVIAARAVDGMDGVFHLAALGSVSRSLKDPEATLSVNVGGTESVLTAARTARVARVVYASSSSVYGAAGGDRRCESDEPRPLSPYAQSKLAGETEHVAPRAGEPRHSAADISRAADVLGYRSRWSLTAGLRETVQWHLDPAEVSQA